MIEPPAIHIIKEPLTDEENRVKVTSNSVASSTNADVNNGPTASVRVVQRKDIPPTHPHPKAKATVKASFFHRGQFRGSFGESEG